MNRKSIGIAIVSAALVLVLGSEAGAQVKICGGFKFGCGANACANKPVGSPCGKGGICFDLGPCQVTPTKEYCGCGLTKGVGFCVALGKDCATNCKLGLRACLRACGKENLNCDLGCEENQLACDCNCSELLGIAVNQGACQ